MMVAIETLGGLERWRRGYASAPHRHGAVDPDGACILCADRLAGVAQPEVLASGAYLVFFASDQAILTEADRQIYFPGCRGIPADRAAQITATGHADTSGSADYNLELSLRRAEAVANELVRQGVPVTDIVTGGQGEEDLLVPTPDGVREPRNRRVWIAVAQPPPPAPVAEAAPVEAEPEAGPEEPGPFAFTIGPLYGHNFGETDDGGENDLAGAQLMFSVLPGFLGGVALKQGVLWSFNGEEDGLTGRSVASLEFAPDLGIVRPILRPTSAGCMAGACRTASWQGPRSA